MTNNKQIKIKLKKCAYIFDDTHTNHTTAKDKARKDNIQRILKEFYNDANKRGQWLEAEERTLATFDGQEIKRIYTTIDGQEIPLNAQEIDKTNRADDIHNHRKRKRLGGLDKAKFKLYEYADNSHAYSNNFNSLSLEEFANADGLDFYRLHFRGASISFIIDDRTGDIYNAYGIEHKKTTRAAILERLDAKSKAAKNEINLIFDYLQN